MTGFARADGTHGEVRWTWEIRSVNGKGLDIRLRLPHGREALDPELRALVRKKITRGNLNATLAITRDAPATIVKLNQSAFDAVLEITEKLQRQIDATPPSMDGLLALKGVLEMSEPVEDDAERDALNAALLAGFETATDHLVAARAEEGVALDNVLNGHLDEIERLTKAAEDNPDRSVDAIRQRLQAQVAALFDTDSGLDPQRLHQEAVVLATKADIREELDRLVAHIAAARALLAEGSVVGRKLDFLAQEFNREVNTLCSKSNSVALTAIGLDMKAVVDQMREQIQNLE